jgi:hypothetical protein
VARIYDRYSHGSFSRGEAASAVGMSASGGAFAGKLGALKDYGLVDEAPDGLRISSAFMQLRANPASSVEGRRAALAAIRRSAVFSRLLDQFAVRVPDVAAIALRLETQDRFNKDRANVVADAFRKSLSDYGLIDAGGSVLTIRDDPRSESEERRPDDDPEDAAGQARADGATSRVRVEVPLGPGRRALLFIPDDLTASDLRRLKGVLAAYVEDDESLPDA